jgi:GT2 family glycosyltransferase
MFFSVIIPTYNRYPALRVCLATLDPDIQGIPASDYEVIVSDDSPEELSQKNPVPDFSWVQAIQGPRRGPAANRNCGAKHSRGEWLIFTDDDCIPQPSFLDAYVKAIRKNPACRVFEGCTLPDRPKERMDEESPINETGGYLWSCNFAIRRDLFEQMKGFCEDFPYAAMEDVDFRLRLAKANEKFLYVPEARVIHPWRQLDVSAKTLRIQLASVRCLFARHPEERPPFLEYFRMIARDYYKGFLVEAPRYRFRGTWRWTINRLSYSLADLILAFDTLFSPSATREQKKAS